MRVTQELYVRADPEELNLWLAAIPGADSGWRRDNTYAGELPDYHCFARTASGGLPAASLFLQKGRQGLSLACIVPSMLDLSVDEYNAIVREFCERVAEP